jgi:hypothetical protein
MRICKLNVAESVFGRGGGFSPGWSFDASAVNWSAITPSVPSTAAPTYVASPTDTAPTYNGQPVTPVNITTTITTGSVNIGTAVVSGTATTTDVAYYDNGVMCIDPAAVSNTPVSSAPAVDTFSSVADYGYSNGGGYSDGGSYSDSGGYW